MSSRRNAARTIFLDVWKKSWDEQVVEETRFEQMKVTYFEKNVVLISV